LQDVAAQKMHISGRIVDSTGAKVIPEASVMAIRLRDSVLVQFTRTDASGKFELSNLAIDSFQVFIEHKNWTTRSVYIMGSKQKFEIQLPDIRLFPKIQEMKEITVSKNRNSIFYNGDTLVYVADSFHVAENAVVEDLLKKLPGIKVEDNGSITSQGKEISKVLVDGDEFFGSDPTIATKNLAAKGVESVQVYEKKNEDAAAGEDDKIQVLDLKLKDEAKRGYFGKVAAATDFGQTSDKPFYETELLYNKFSKKTKISVFMLGSNTPKSNFGFGDMNKFGLDNERNSSGMTFWDQSSRSNTSGIPKTLKTGVYYNDRLSDKVKMGFNYAYYESQLQANSSSQTQYFLQDSTYFTKDSARNYSSSSSHRFNLNLAIDLDSLTKLEVKPTVSFDKGITDNRTIQDFRDQNFASYLTTNVDNSYDSKGITSNSEAILRRKFAKKDREFELKYIFDYKKNESVGGLTNQTNYLSSGNDSLLEQRKTNANGSRTNYVIANYTEPLNAHFLLNFEYYIEKGISNQDRYTYNQGPILDSFTVIDSLYTNVFDNSRFQQRGTTSLTYLYKNHRFTAGIGYRNILIDNTNVFNGNVVNQNLSNWLPKFSYQFKPSMSKRINLTYTTYSTPPNANDVQPVRDNSNPNRVQIGNQNLKPNYVHSLNFNANSWKAMTGRYLWSGGTASLTQNGFGTNTSYDPYGRQVSQTVNVNGNTFATLYAGGGLPILNRKLTFEPNINTTYVRNINYVNNLKNTTTTTTLSGGLNLELRFDSLEITLGGTYTYVNPISTLSSISNKPYSTQRYVFEGDWRLPQHFHVKWNWAYTMNRGRAAYNKDLFIVNLEVERAFLQTENLILGLSVNDLLNQNINVQRSVNGNMITDNFTRIISRYFLVRLTYKFNNNKTREEEPHMWH
jgi:hypothetical protein